VRSTGLSIERDRVECNKSERHSSALANFVTERDDDSSRMNHSITQLRAQTSRIDGRMMLRLPVISTRLTSTV
jgi:hypothetical protein